MDCGILTVFYNFHRKLDTSATWYTSSSVTTSLPVARTSLLSVLFGLIGVGVSHVGTPDHVAKCANIVYGLRIYQFFLTEKTALLE